MLNTINWLHFIWELTQKFTKDYTSTKGNWTNYNLKFEFLGWYEIVRVPLNVYNTLKEWFKYILPVWTSTSKNIDFVSLFVRSKKWTIYTIEWEVVEIPESGKLPLVNENPLKVADDTISV